MAVDANREDLRIGVVGAGAMGRGIAQVALTGGMHVSLYDVSPEAADKAQSFVHSMIDRSVEKGRLDREAATAAKGRLKITRSLGAFRDCDVVVEAVVESLEVKQKIFRELEAATREHAILASNTSSLRITSIAAPCKRRTRIAGMHFFNPVPLMKLVEIVRAQETDDETISVLSTVAQRMGRVPVVVQDAPGFLVNLGGRAYTTEALKIVSQGIATPAEVDAIMRDACGFRMGPFELMDLTGIDVNYPVSQIIYNGYFQDPRLATSPLHEAMRESGRLGVKTRAGFYDYDDEGRIVPRSADFQTDAPPAGKLALADPENADLAALARDLEVEIGDVADASVPILAAPVGEDCTAHAVRLGLDASRLVAVDVLTGVHKRATIMAAPGADPAKIAAVAAALRRITDRITLIKDSPGFVAQRIRAMIANLGCEMAQIGIATPEDIDKGMTLGLNYPAGPLALTEEMGAESVLAILRHLQEISGEDRYRPSQWLRRRALLGLDIHAPD